MLKKMVAERYLHRPDLLDAIPSEDGIELEKLEKALFTTDNCNAAQKLARLAVDELDMQKQPCWNHYRNTWIHGVEDETNQFLKGVLRLHLDECDPKLRVKMLFSAFCRAFDKAFNLSRNYPKGFGENFLEHVKEHHPTFPLYHVARCRGGRFDIILECAVPIYMNRYICVEYLDYCLKMVGKKRDNILMKNLWCLLSSDEMVAQTRFYGILFFAFCIPLRWLTGKTHELLNYPEGVPAVEQWCAKSMCKVGDHLLCVIEKLIATPLLFLSQIHMMSLFSRFMDELPPFEEYYYDSVSNTLTR